MIWEIQTIALQILMTSFVNTSNIICLLVGPPYKTESVNLLVISFADVEIKKTQRIDQTKNSKNTGKDKL